MTERSFLFTPRLITSSSAKHVGFPLLAHNLRFRGWRILGYVSRSWILHMPRFLREKKIAIFGLRPISAVRRFVPNAFSRRTKDVSLSWNIHVECASHVQRNPVHKLNIGRVLCVREFPKSPESSNGSWNRRLLPLPFLNKKQYEKYELLFRQYEVFECKHVRNDI